MPNLRLLEVSDAGKRKSFPENTFPESNTEAGLFLWNKNSEHSDLGLDSYFEHSGGGK